MRLFRFGNPGNEKPGVLIDGKRKDLSAHFSDWNRSFFRNNGLEELNKFLKANTGLPDVSENERWGSCVDRPGKVICIGLNYSDHAKESGMAVPEEPIVFQKGSNTVVGPYDEVL